MSDANAKVALITGANKGIGLETARQLGKLGVTVLVGSRDLGRGEQRRRYCAARAWMRARSS